MCGAVCGRCPVYYPHPRYPTAINCVHCKKANPQLFTSMLYCCVLLYSAGALYPIHTHLPPQSKLQAPHVPRLRAALRPGGCTAAAACLRIVIRMTVQGAATAIQQPLCDGVVAE